jgi:hypothetical protein
MELGIEPQELRAPPRGDEYVILQSKECMKKIQNMPVYSGKWFWLSTIADVAVSGKRVSSAVCTSKNECNKYDLTAAQCF